MDAVKRDGCATAALEAVDPGRDRHPICKSLLRQMADRTGDRVVLRQPLVEKDYPPQVDFLRSQWIVDRNKCVRIFESLELRQLIPRIWTAFAKDREQRQSGTRSDHEHPRSLSE